MTEIDVEQTLNDAWEALDEQADELQRHGFHDDAKLIRDSRDEIQALQATLLLPDIATLLAEPFAAIKERQARIREIDATEVD